MKSSQLQIDNYVYKKIHLESFEAPEPKQWHVDSKVEALRHKDDTDKWLIELTVSLRGDGEQSPYIGEFTIAGFFRVLDPGPAGTNLVNVNGPAILYSAIREMVFNLTSRGPHRAVLLPSMTFIDRRQDEPDESEQKGAPAKLVAKG